MRFPGYQPSGWYTKRSTLDGEYVVTVVNSIINRSNPVREDQAK